jgi:hypothetical protein
MREIEPMNDSVPDFDITLAERFRSEHTHISAEPFVGNTLKLVATERARVHTIRNVMQAALLIGMIWASPWIIKASSLLSSTLDSLFAKLSALLETPVGMGIAALTLIVSAALLRRLTSR